MKEEYDFSTAERGKFFRENAVLRPPIHLDPQIFADLSARAIAKGIPLDRLVNELLEKDIELIKAAS